MSVLHGHGHTHVSAVYWRDRIWISCYCIDVCWTLECSPISNMCQLNHMAQQQQQQRRNEIQAQYCIWYILVVCAWSIYIILTNWNWFQNANYTSIPKDSLCWRLASRHDCSWQMNRFILSNEFFANIYNSLWIPEIK